MLGVGAPVDSLQYKVEIERLDDDPIGPDPELLTDDADPCAIGTPVCMPLPHMRGSAMGAE